MTGDSGWSRSLGGETVAVIAHGEHVADVVPSDELDRLRETTLYPGIQGEGFPTLIMRAAVAPSGLPDAVVQVGDSGAAARTLACSSALSGA